MEPVCTQCDTEMVFIETADISPIWNIGPVTVRVYQCPKCGFVGHY